MSCVIGIKDGSRILLSGDSAASTDDGYVEIRKDAKVFRRDNMIIGYVGSCRAGQLMRYVVDIPAASPGRDVYEYMADSFVEAMQTCFDDHCVDPEGNQYLVAFSGRLFRVDSDFAVAEVACDWDAIGSGSDAARGALMAQDHLIRSHNLKIDPERRILDAMLVSESLTSGVRSPFTIINL